MSTNIPLHDLPVVDPEALERLREWGSDELVSKMLELFLESAPGRVRQIRDGLGGEALVEAEKGAHSLKSSAANLGAMKLQVASQRMEQLACDGRSDEARDLLPELESAYEEARDALGRMSNGDRSGGSR